MSDISRGSLSESPATMALVTRRDAREVRWVANWASLISDLLLDPTVARKIRVTLARLDVQEALHKIYEEEANNDR